MTTKEPEKIKIICERINKLLSLPNFYKDLCNISDNNIDKVIENLSIIINYYLVTDDLKISYNLTELLGKSVEEKTTKEYLIHPSNSYYRSMYKACGLNRTAFIDGFEQINLCRLEAGISFSRTELQPYYISFAQNIKDAIISSFSCPNIVYKSILKQPHNKELPMVVGTDETNYYQSILDIRLKNATDTYKQTAAKLGHNMMKKYIGRNPLLIIFPSSTNKYKISDKEIDNQETTTIISPNFLGFIEIPTRYKLLSICATNKSLRNGELINITNGEQYTKKLSEPQQERIITYSRIESVSVTNEFEYTNNELTQDIDYDLDLIYGYLETNRTRSLQELDQTTNISIMKKQHDIRVRKTSRKYMISNGRHRILYLKYFYLINHKAYRDTNTLDKLKQLVTIPMNVEYTIEDKSINEYLKKVLELSNQVQLYKVNINNDSPNIIIVINNHVYSVNNVFELQCLYSYLSISYYNNSYYIGENTEQNNINYKELFEYLIITLKDKLFTMDFLDIINYLKKVGYYIENIHYTIEVINYFKLYNEYIQLQHTLQRIEVYKEENDIVESVIEKIEKRKVGQSIMSIIKLNPNLMQLSFKELYEHLITYPEYKAYDREFIELSLKEQGYESYRLTYYYKNDVYTKKHLL